jgi:hypothetical protein
MVDENTIGQECPQMTDDEVEAAWCCAHAGGATAGPIHSFSQGIFFLERQILTAPRGATFDLASAVQMLAGLARGFSTPREDVQEANKRITRALNERRLYGPIQG